MAKTFVAFLLDRTGSMGRLKPATIETFNTYLASLQDAENAGEITFTLIQFYGRGADTIYHRVPLREAEPLSEAGFLPKGRTPFIDATYKTIRAVELAAEGANGAETSSAGAPDLADHRISLCMQSDGRDNASTEYSQAELAHLIGERRALGWQFIFIGVGSNSADEAENLGLSLDETLSFGADFGAAREAGTAAAQKTADFAARLGVDRGAAEPATPSRNIRSRPAVRQDQRIPDGLLV